MAKVTALGWGAVGSNADDPDYFEEQEQRWGGTNSSTSIDKPEKTGSVIETPDPSPAPTTEPPSKRVLEVNSTADSTVGSGAELPDSPSDKLPAKKAWYKSGGSK